MDPGPVILGIKANPGSGAYIENVPFFPQDELMCGPAALASVIGYWGADGSMREVANKVYEEKLGGTLPIDLVIFAKEKGFMAAFYSGGLEDLKRNLSKGIPLILFLNLGLREYPVGHYIVAVGYSDAAGVVLAHSAMNKEEVFTYQRLEKLWSKTNYSTIAAVPR